jgi:hypothetical protein
MVRLNLQTLLFKQEVSVKLLTRRKRPRRAEPFASIVARLKTLSVTGSSEEGESPSHCPAMPASGDISRSRWQLHAPSYAGDEVGYLAYGPDAANVLFHVVNNRHLRKRRMIFKTNKRLNEWGKVLHDEGMAAAILDRVLEQMATPISPQ